MDEQRGIGINNNLPWRLSDDLKAFKTRTMGHHIVMGRKTYESIGRPLPGRTMIVVSRNKSFSASGCIVVDSPSAALDTARAANETECFIIGGAELYRQMLEECTDLYISKVKAVCECDAFFVELREEDWVEVERIEHTRDANNDFDWTLVHLNRKAALTA